MLGQSRGRVLVVDDNEMNRELLSQELEDAGYDVECADGGQQCLAMVRERLPDLIVLDVMMPEVSGLDVLRELRQQFSRTALPIIMATAKTRPEDMVEALQLGANDYVTKPIDIMVLLARLEVLVDVRQQAQPRSLSVFKALNEEQRLEAASDHYCEVCGLVAEETTSACTECFASRPDAGWAAIPRDTLRYLGRTIGNRYYVDRHLGQGGGGEVFRVLELDIERHFVAKMLTIAGTGSRHGRILLEQAKREVTTLAKLQNPHVVHIFEMVQLDDGRFAVIMEYVDGFDVAGALQKHGALPPPLAVEIIRQITLGLHAVHDLGLIHCDLKPSNVMLQPMPGRKYFAKLVDFGIARTAGVIGDDPHFVGTPRYCAPEQFFHERPLDARTDIYALGLVLYEMVSNDQPFGGPSITAFMAEKTVDDSVPTLVDRFGESTLTWALDDLIRKMSRPNPDQRLSSVDEVIEAIEELVASGVLASHRLTTDERKGSAWDAPTVLATDER